MNTVNGEVDRGPSTNEAIGIAPQAMNPGDASHSIAGSIDVDHRIEAGRYLRVQGISPESRG
ncbi:MAG: hypothetical protein ACJAY5_000016 [Actinomycetes bacterium]|jgi:hypothetical protein